MNIAIMQPYVFPYIGYFQLIKAVDIFVIYDDVQYIKGGWINRNRILLNGKEHLFTIPCKQSSPNKLIKDIDIDWGRKDIQKLNKTIVAAYKKAPYFESVYQLLNRLLINDELKTITDLATESIREVCNYLEIKTEIKLSSLCNYENEHLKKEERVIDIVRKEKGTSYINAIGGQSLYSKEMFELNSIELKFIKSLPISYNQSSNEFVPWLSIIDVLMYNGNEGTKEFLSNYELI